MKFKTLLTASLATLFGGCMEGAVDTSSTAAPTWDEFVASTIREPDTGIYIVDGDTPVEDIKQLREIYDRAYLQDGALIVNTLSTGSDDVWSAAIKTNITYCVSTSSFGSNYSTVVAAMNAAAGAWEAVANVNFVHLTAYDSNCTATQSNVVFDVRQTTVTSYLARAFFPANSRSSRNVLVSTSAYGNISPWTLTGILRHELGHTLGFRHEHTRLGTSHDCYEDSNWRSLTTYDSASVMHYPQCDGTQTGDLVLTARDASGASALYGAPGSGGGGGTGTPVTTSLAGSVALRAWVTSVAYPVVAGTTFSATMTGTGNPDLYVSWGAAPTSSVYACRPYLGGASESCSRTVPAGTTTAYVGVYGYSAGTYNVAISYTRP